MVLKDELHRLEVKFCREIEDGEVFVVERLCHRGLFDFAIGQMFVKLAMRLEVPIDIHAHEGDELYKTRIDPTKNAGIA